MTHALVKKFPIISPVLNEVPLINSIIDHLKALERLIS